MNLYPVTVVMVLGAILALSMIVHTFNFERMSIIIASFGIMTSLLVILPRIGTFVPISFLYRYEGDLYGRSGHIVLWNHFRMTHENGNLWLFHVTIAALVCLGGYAWIILRANTCRQADALVA